MRNLEIIRRHKGPHFPDLSESAVCVGDNCHLLICDRHFGRLSKVTTDRIETHPAVLLEDEVIKDVFQMQYFSNTRVLYLAKRDGTLLSLQTDVKPPKMSSLMKSTDGIQTFAVSPDSAFLIILTTTKKILLIDLSLDKTSPVETLSGSSGPATIIWRNDGRYFAINCSTCSPESETEQRVIKIYDKDGTPYSTTALDSNDFTILDESLAWQPSGGLLATYGKFSHGDAVLLFGLDGQKQSHFLVDHVNEDILDISWNSSSDILATRYETSVELWTQSKNIWELKKILNNVDNDHEKIIFSRWDTELPYTIHVLFENGVYITDDVAYSYSSGFSNGSAITASWNGNKIYCTPFRENSAPPPYGFLQAKVDGTEHIVHIKVSKFWDGFLCVTYTGHILIYRHTETALTVVKRFMLPNDVYIHRIDGWAWPNSSTLCCTHSGSILVFDLGDILSENIGDGVTNQTVFDELTLKDSIWVNKENLLRIQTLLQTSDDLESNEILAEADDNAIFLVNLKTHTNEKLVKFPHVFAHYRYIKLPNSVLVFAHDPLSRELYMSSSQTPDLECIKLSTDCTSILIFKDNLLLTTLSGSLEIYNKNALLEILKNPNSADVLENKYCREIEKGSVIVSCCINRMSETSLILQVIPRGSFETICPLPLSG